MSIAINADKCIGCEKCNRVCPGSLIYMDENHKSYMKYPKDCWGCASCLKECPVEAISLYLGVDIGGRGSKMQVEVKSDNVRWSIRKIDGTKKVININPKSSNQY